jgi:D-alanyl-D-alanine carboxypeptidase
MFKRLFALFVIGATLPFFARAAQPDDALRSRLQSDLAHYLSARAKAEHISAISLSVYLPGSASNINVAVGSTEYGGAGGPVTTENLYQIGSNTKSFTSATILQLEDEGKLSVDDTVGKWLPQYPSWKNITIRRLLNMTSDIPTYDDVTSMLTAYAANPTQDWPKAKLVAVVYPHIADPGWLYSNTAYILSEMIIERATGNRYTDEIRRRFLNNPAIGLDSTYYEPNMYPDAITSRMVAGYFYSTDSDNNGLQPLYGKDMRDLSLSWAQGAGGIVSTPEDVTRWTRALYGGAVLKPKQQKELESLVSLENGKPIAATTPQHSRGFGLGVAQMLMPKLGRIWFYEGMTLGYRVAYAYFPQSHAVFAVGLNSQPDKKQDEIGKLFMSLYDTLHADGKM